MSMRVKVAIAWTVLIAVSCLLPGQAVPSSSLPSFDKVAHAFLFLVFALLWSGPAPKGSLIALVIVFGISLAFGTELLQQILPWKRSAEWLDVFADLSGLAIGVVLSLWIYPRVATRLAKKRFRRGNFRV